MERKKQKIYTACTFGTFYKVFANVYKKSWLKNGFQSTIFSCHMGPLPVIAGVILTLQMVEHTWVIGETFANNANDSNMIALSTGFHF